jgi:cell division protein FtsA
MENTDIVVAGVDIGTTKIVAIIGTMNEHGKLNILGTAKTESLGVSRGVVTHITQTMDAIKKAMKEAEEIAGCQIKTVNVGIAGQHIRSVQHSGSRMRDNIETEITQEDINLLIAEMHKLVMLPGEKVIDVLPQDFTVDNEKGGHDPIGMAGIRLEANFHIITGNIGAAKNIVRCVEGADMEVDNLILEPLASAEAVLSAEEKEAGVVLVDIGGGTTDVAIFKEGIIRHTAVIPFGGNIITEDIKQGCSIIKSQAEQLKVKFGSAIAETASSNEIVSIPGIRGREAKEISLANLANIIQSRAEEIIEQVYYEIRNSGLERQLIAGIVVTGGGSQLRDITQLFEFLTGMDTRIGYPTEHLATGTDDITSPMYSTGVGLILKGFERIRNNTTPAEATEETFDASLEDSKKSGMGSFLDFIKKKSESFFDDGIS